MIRDDEKAPLADEEKVPLSTDGSRENIVDRGGDGVGGGDGRDVNNVEDASIPINQSETTVVKKSTITTTTGSQGIGTCLLTEIFELEIYASNLRVYSVSVLNLAHPKSSAHPGNTIHTSNSSVDLQYSAQVISYNMPI